MSDERERDIAIRDAHQADAEEQYFSARPDMVDVATRRRVFGAGFRFAWDNLAAQLAAAKINEASLVQDCIDAAWRETDLRAQLAADQSRLAEIEAQEPEMCIPTHIGVQAAHIAARGQHNAAIEFARRYEQPRFARPVQPAAQTVAPEYLAIQKMMARLADLLDEDQFAEMDRIATGAGVEPPVIPDAVVRALDRMCRPLDPSILRGATAEADAHSMKVIRDYIVSTAPPASQQPAAEGVADDVRDAARYRWLRNKENSLERFQTNAKNAGGGWRYNTTSCYHIVDEVRELKHGDDLDAAIDAAILAAQQEPRHD